MLSSREKADLLKDTIYHLYSKEGRSKAYIGKLLGINRTIISEKITEWDFPEAKPKQYIKPSTQKFINKNRMLIKSRLDDNISIVKIAKELHVSRDYLIKSVISRDEVLKKSKR
jgi:biotin operon repressor